MAIKHPARLLFEVLVVMLFLVLAEVAAAHHSWGPYHWARTSNPFTLKVGDNVSGAWDHPDKTNLYLATTTYDWSNVPAALFPPPATPPADVLDLTIVPGSTDPRRCKPKSGRVEVCNAKYGYNGWLGVAQIWISSSHITQGTTKLNDSYFNTSTYNTPAWRNLVMCQEVGHDLGLDHQDEAFNNANLGTCMDYTSDPSSNQHPNAHDYEQLATIYAHTDSFNSYDTTASGSVPAAAPLPTAVSGDLNSVREWGRLVRSSNGGRTETYERDLGHGHRLITHVIWAF